MLQSPARSTTHGSVSRTTFWEHAATIPPKSCEGAPASCPDIAYLLMPSLSAIWGSFSKAETALSESEVWEILCKLLCCAWSYV